MNKEQLLERLTALEDEAKKLREILEAPEKKERWRAETNGGEYFTITQSGVAASMDYNWISDRIKFDSFNYFQAKAAAERIERVQLAYRKLDWAIRQFEVVDKPGSMGIDFCLDMVSNIQQVESYYNSSPIPKLKYYEDAEYILSNYKAELLTFLTRGDR